MKRIAIALLACLPVFGVGSVGQSINPLGSLPTASGIPDTRPYVVSITWVGDSVTGTVPSTVINISQFPQLQGYRLTQIEVQPGSPNPTPNYGITLADGSGVDLLQGQGANLSATVAFYAGSLVSPPLLVSPTFALSGNSVASARGTVQLYFVPAANAPNTTGLAGLSANQTFTGTNTFNGTFVSSGTTTLTGLINTYNNTVTQGQGVAWIPCVTSQRTESAADSNLLTCAIPAQVGSYRIRFAINVSASNTATLGWTATWTDPNGNPQSPANLPVLLLGSATTALTYTVNGSGGDAWGYADIEVNGAATPIVVKLTFSGTSFTAKVSASVERII